MAEIIPFRAVRPTRDKAHLVASRSYVSYSPRHLNRKLQENPFSFIHIINPEHGSRIKTKPNSSARFRKVKARFEQFLTDGVLIQDRDAAFYLYRQSSEQSSSMGLICGVSVTEYNDGKIKIHEQTITSRVDVFTKYLDVCDFNAEPVLLTYTTEASHLNSLMRALAANRAEYEFSTTDRIKHELWVIDKPDQIKAIQAEMKAVDKLYIADGHHRMASSAMLSQTRKQQANQALTDFALALVVPEQELRIQSFHRIIHLEDGLDERAFLKALAQDFKIEKSAQAVYPEQTNTFGMCLASGWYHLELLSPIKSNSAVDLLDTMILTRKVLEPLFGIFDQKIDRRISFLPENQAVSPIEKSIYQGRCTAIFTLHAIGVPELVAVADANEIMPPKSTYIEPKLRSGLTIMRLS